MKDALFVPCYVDAFFPEVAIATLELLERFGCEVDSPLDQTCCGQPMANSGCEADAAGAEALFVRNFGGYEHIVSPSGSCVHHVREHFTAIEQTPQVAQVRARTVSRILAESAGNNTDAAINFVTRLDAEFLRAGYRDLMRRLYEPRNYYRRIRTFLRSYRPRGPSPRLSGADAGAFLKSLWVLGMRNAGRTQFWILLWMTLLVSPRKLRVAVELSILGHHFRRVANGL